MDELAAARAVLTALEKQEQDLLEQLCSVRVSARAQKAKIEQIIKRFLTSPISRFPHELFLQVFELVVHSAEFPRSSAVQVDCKKCLAGVSRHWRNLVLHFPTLWTTIEVTPAWSEALVKTHLRRSSQLPIDIKVHSWDRGFDDSASFFGLLDIISDHAHRWRSFAIENRGICVWEDLAFDRLSDLTFPLLTRVTISHALDSVLGQLEPSTLVFLQSEACPRLEYLQLHSDFTHSKDFLVPSTLTTLDLDFYDLYDEGQSWLPEFFKSLSCLARLSTLSLAGDIDTDSFGLLPDSIHLPLLEKFVCNVTCPTVLMQAIVAPRRRHLECCPTKWADSDSPHDIFASSDSRFSDISHLALCGSNNWDKSEAGVLCLVFSGIRHLVLDDSTVTPVLFLGHPESSLYWNHLESLTICGLGGNDPNFLDHFASWLEKRLGMGRPVLQLKFCNLKRRWSISSICERLHGLCILE